MILQIHCIRYVVDVLSSYINFVSFLICNLYFVTQSLSANTDNNIIISPLSLHMLLSLLSNGAEGSTLNELRSALGYDKESLNQEYKDLIVLLNVR